MREKRLVDFQRILEDISYEGWTFAVFQDTCADGQIAGYYLQIIDQGATNTRTGEWAPWYGRKWRLSTHMTRSEVVQTAFLAAHTAAEHELREMFTYRGRAIFGPHYDVDKLVELVDTGEHEDVRS